MCLSFRENLGAKVSREIWEGLINCIGLIFRELGREKDT